MVSATVTLYKDIGLSPSYMRTIDFPSKTVQTTWFNSISSSLRTTLTNVNYNKLQNSFAIHESIGDVYDYTYCRIQNLDDSGRTYYGFVSGVTLVDEETTRFDILMDPIQTFMCEWSIGESFVVREHIDRWGSGDNPINVKPSEIKASTFMRVDDDKTITSNLKVVVIAFSSDDYVYIKDDENNIDKIFYAYAIVDTSDLDRNVPTIRATRNVSAYGLFTYDGTQCIFPSYNQIIDGTFMSILGINPVSIVSISILPYASINTMVFTSSDTHQVTFPSLNAYTASGLTGSSHYVVFDEVTTEITFKNTEYDTCYYFGVIPTYQKAEGDGGAYVMLYGVNNLAVVETDVDNPDDTTICVPLLTPSIVTSIGYTPYNLAIDKPSKPTNGDIADASHEPAMFMAPFKSYNIIDYKGNSIGTFPDFIVAESNTNANIGLMIKPVFDVSGMSMQFSIGDVSDIDISERGAEGNNAVFRTDGLPFVNDNWLSYKLTSLDSDRSNAKLQAMATIITGGIYGAYGGALVGSRSASGDRDDAETRNTLLKRGAIGASIIGGAASLAAGAVNAYVGLQAQKNKENSVKNQASEINSVTDISSYITDANLHFITLKCDDVNYNMGYSTLKYYGQDVSTFKTPNIKSRKYYNYIITQGCSIDGSLNADIKNQLASIFDSGITIFHGDYCNEPDYPTDSNGNEYENIERSLL